MPSLYSLSNKMDNSLLAVRDINHKYIVVERMHNRIIYGEIEPGIRIGKYLLGSTKEEILPRLEDYKVWEEEMDFAYILLIILNYGLELIMNWNK
ncbi:MAG: hypothetical protein ACLRSR_06410 [[Ruminococcus] lactaris]